jgi:hypothetical protein
MKTIKLSILFVLVISGLTEAQNSWLFEFREFQKAVKKIVLGDKLISDVDNSNNVYQR